MQLYYRYFFNNCLFNHTTYELRAGIISRNMYGIKIIFRRELAYYQISLENWFGSSKKTIRALETWKHFKTFGSLHEGCFVGAVVGDPLTFKQRPSNIFIASSFKVFLFKRQWTNIAYLFMSSRRIGKIPMVLIRNPLGSTFKGREYN